MKKRTNETKRVTLKFKNADAAESAADLLRALAKLGGLPGVSIGTDTDACRTVTLTELGKKPVKKKRKKMPDTFVKPRGGATSRRYLNFIAHLFCCPEGSVKLSDVKYVNINSNTVKGIILTDNDDDECVAAFGGMYVTATKEQIISFGICRASFVAWMKRHGATRRRGKRGVR